MSERDDQNTSQPDAPEGDASQPEVPDSDAPVAPAAQPGDDATNDMASETEPGQSEDGDSGVSAGEAGDGAASAGEVNATAEDGPDDDATEQIPAADAPDDATERIAPAQATEDDHTRPIAVTHPWSAEDPDFDADLDTDADYPARTAGYGTAGYGTAGYEAAGYGAEPPPDVLPEERSRNPWLGIVVRTLIAAVVLGAIYVGLAHYFGGRIPSGTSVQGIDIGGLTPEAAQRTLESRLASFTDQPVIVNADGERFELIPEESGLTIDIEATIQGLTGVNYDPRVLWRQISGTDYDLTLITRADPTVVRAQVSEFADQIGTDPVEGSVSLSGGSVQVTPSEDGLALDVVQTSELVVAGWPATREVAAVLQEVEPVLLNSEIDRFVDEEAGPALISAIVVEVDDARAVISQNQLSRLLTVVETDGRELGLELDEESLVAIVADSTGDVVGGATDARVRLSSGGEPEIVPAQEGAELDEESVVEAVRGVLTNPDPDQRVVQVDTVTVEPDLTTEEAEDWNFEVMSEFGSEFPDGPGNEARTQNLRVGMGHVNGTVVMPGEQFSLADALSPVNADGGYVNAGVIVDGRLVEGMGGGLSQVSTTVLNGAWDAGLQLDAFTPHSYYITRYPEGKEATIAIGVIDNQWTNDTESPVVVQAWVDDADSTIRIRFWGDPQYEVETITSPRSNIVQPEEDTSDDPNCLPQSPQIGFTVTVTRVLSQGGSEVTRRDYSHTYHPADGVVCTARDN